MRNPFACLAKRDTARPSLRERAASLKASAARVIRRRPSEQDDPYEGIPCPNGFVPYPFDKPMSFASIGHVVIPAEARRLLNLAQDEEARRLQFIGGDVPEDKRAERHRHIRSLLRLDALEALVRDQGAPPPAAQDIPPRARHFIDSFDLSRIEMRDLAAIHDAARLIAGVADAIGCQPRSYDEEDGEWNAIGLFADAISETCGGVLADTVREALDREPKNGWERGLRLKILAEHTIDNDDKSAVAIFARDFQAMA